MTSRHEGGSATIDRSNGRIRVGVRGRWYRVGLGVVRGRARAECDIKTKVLSIIQITKRDGVVVRT